MGQRSQQFAFDFEPGLTAKHRRLEDCVAHTVHNHREGVDGIASDLDMGGSELSRRLNAHLEAMEGAANNRPLRVSDFVRILEATKDYRPIFWLVERFLQDPQARRDLALSQIPAAVELLTALAQQAGVALPAAKKR